MKKNVLRKVLAFALTGTMLMGMLSGCGDSGSSSTTDSADTQTTTDNTAFKI